MFVQHFGNNVTRGKAKANAKAKTKAKTSSSSSSNQNRDVPSECARSCCSSKSACKDSVASGAAAMLRCCPVAASLPDKAALAAWLTSALSGGGGASVCVGVTNVKHYSSTVNTS